MFSRCWGGYREVTVYFWVICHLVITDYHTVWITFCVSRPISSLCVLLLCFRGILCTTCWCYVYTALWCSVFDSLYHVNPYLQIHHRLLAVVYTNYMQHSWNLEAASRCFLFFFFFLEKNLENEIMWMCVSGWRPLRLPDTDVTIYVLVWDTVLSGLTCATVSFSYFTAVLRPFIIFNAVIPALSVYCVFFFSLFY